MKKLINGLFAILSAALIAATVIVGAAWLFDTKPENLYTVWEILWAGKKNEKHH